MNEEIAYGIAFIIVYSIGLLTGLFLREVYRIFNKAWKKLVKDKGDKK